MSITLELPQHLKKELETKASSLSLSLEEYILQILSSRRQISTQIHTGADLVAYWQRENLIGTRPDLKDSQEHARHIRAQAEKRVRT